MKMSVIFNWQWSWLQLQRVGHISDYWPGSGGSDEAGDTGRGPGAGDPTPGTLTPALTPVEVGRTGWLLKTSPVFKWKLINMAFFTEKIIWLHFIFFTEEQGDRVHSTYEKLSCKELLFELKNIFFPSFS